MKTDEKTAWLMCALGALVLFCALGMPVGAFTPYMPYLIEGRHLTGFQGAVIPTFRGLASVICMFFVDRYLEVTGIRKGIAIMFLVGAGAFLLYGIDGGAAGCYAASALSGVTYGLGGMIPVSVLIHRWFHPDSGSRHEGLALGICMAGTGAASIVLPPVITLLVENVSLKAAFAFEALLYLIAALLVVLFVKEEPEWLRNDAAAQAESPEDRDQRKGKLSLQGKAAKSAVLIYAGAFLIGITAYGTLQYLAVLFREVNFAAMFISSLISVYGASQMCGKFLYGQVSDTLGSHRSYLIFFPMYIAGMLLCASSGQLPHILSGLGVILFGLGMPLATIGITIFARDISEEMTYPSVLRKVQMLYMIGSMAAGPLTGAMISLLGRYVLSFRFYAAVAAVCMGIVAAAYRLMDKQR